MQINNNHYWIQRLPFYYGWIIVLISALTLFASSPGQTYVNSIFVDPMLTELEWSRTTYSAMYTVGSLVAALAMVFVGKSLDKFGARILLPFLCIAMFFATFWMSNVNTAVQLLVGFAMLRTIGQGSMSLVGTNMVSNWFVKKRGIATGIASWGQGISLLTMPILAHILIQNFGWRNTWTIFGALVNILLLPFAILFVRDKPEKIGLLPDGAVTLNQELSNENRIKENAYTLKEAMQTRVFWTLIASGVANPMIITGLHFHHISILMSKGVPLTLAVTTMGLFGPINLVFNLITGYLADRISNRILMAIGQFGIALTLISILYINQPWHSFIYILISSISMSMFNTSYTVIWANYFGRKSLGSIRGFSATTMVTFAAFGALPFGFIYDRTLSYDQAALFLLFIPLICCIFCILSTPPPVKTD